MIQSNLYIIVDSIYEFIGKDIYVPKKIMSNLVIIVE